MQGLVIGLVIFIVLIAVQALVITKGATRIAEVAARFTLDAMPMKQAAVESEYNQGAISEDEARVKKLEIQRKTDFYGSMDGATKFVWCKKFGKEQEGFYTKNKKITAWIFL